MRLNEWLFPNVEIVYNRDKKLYYIKNFACPLCIWLSVEKYKEKPIFYVNSMKYIVEYDKGAYYRSVLPFAFWKIKSGKREKIKKKNELVRDYIVCDEERHKRTNQPNWRSR